MGETGAINASTDVGQRMRAGGSQLNDTVAAWNRDVAPFFKENTRTNISPEQAKIKISEGNISDLEWNRLSRLSDALIATPNVHKGKLLMDFNDFTARTLKGILNADASLDRAEKQQFPQMDLDKSKECLINARKGVARILDCATGGCGGGGC
jgi:hypothetical protein